MNRTNPTFPTDHLYRSKDTEDKHLELGVCLIHFRSSCQGESMLAGWVARRMEPAFQCLWHTVQLPFECYELRVRMNLSLLAFQESR